MSAIVVYVEYGDLPVWSFELDGCNVVGAGYVNRVPIVGVQFAVYPYDRSNLLFIADSVDWEYCSEICRCSDFVEAGEVRLLY